MCKTCYQHTHRAWYHQEKYHNIRSGFLGPLRERIYNSVLGPYLRKFVESTAYSAADRDVISEGFERRFMNFMTKNIIGGQVISNLKDTSKVVDMANDVFLHFCGCKRSTHPDHPKDYRCIYLNHLAKFYRKYHPEDGRFIDKDEAKEMMKNGWKTGKYFTVMFGVRPYVDAICLCDKYCSRWWYPELEWAATSFYVAKARKSEKCDSCGTCIEKCLAGAIRIDEDGVQVNPLRCIGCSICVRYCPHGVFSMEPRRQYIDFAIGKRVVQKTKRSA